MDLNQFNEKLERQFDEHPDRMFVIKSLFLVLLIIFGKICLGSWLIPILSVIFINYQAWQCVISGKGIRRSIWKNISLLIVPIKNTNDRMAGAAWVSLTKITYNYFRRYIDNFFFKYYFHLRYYNFSQSNIVFVSNLA